MINISMQYLCTSSLTKVKKTCFKKYIDQVSYYIDQ